MSEIAVLGSFVVDHVAWAPRRPARGETLIGSRYETFLGGKGFNQAVAAARMGGTVEMAGALGTDAPAAQFIAAMDREGIGRAAVVELEGRTGVGLPLVTDDGDVSIVGVAGVNDLLGPDDVSPSTFESARVCIIQCEVPAAASARASTLATGALIVLNAAPAGERAEQLLEIADILIVNEPELAALTGAEVPDDLTEIARSAESLAAGRRLDTVVVTLASRGAVAVSRSGSPIAIAAHEISAVDATGAGDAFTGAFSVAVSQGASTREALELANAAGAASAEVAGAEPSMPRRDKVESFLGSGGPQARTI